MGREVKRVDIDFDYPLNMVWKGYYNPYRPLQCKACNESGYSKELQQLNDSWYSFEETEWICHENGKRHNNKAWCYHLTEVEIKALIDDGRLMDFTRVPINEKQKKDVEDKIKNGGNSWLPYNNGKIPTPEEVNSWAISGMGHDSINRMICVRARALSLGIKESDFNCKYCDGRGYLWPDDKYEELAENFEDIEPPEGNGYQLWETTSEGSPVSPVFKTPEELARWLCDNNASSFGEQTESYETWLKFVSKDGWAVSMVHDGESLKSGVAASVNR
jgi:hypothetical protein